MIKLVESFDIEDIRYTKPERKPIDFCPKTDILLLIKVYGIQLGFFITKKVSEYGYKCHYFLAMGIRKFSTRIFHDVVSYYSSRISGNANWYCIAGTNQKEVRHFVYRHGFRLVEKFGNKRLYKINFGDLSAALIRH